MILAKENNVTYLFTSPLELRKLANQMEKQILAANLGDSTIVKELMISETEILAISYPANLI